MIKLPAIISDGMIIEKNAKIWGHSEPAENIKAQFMGKSYETTADNNGYWELHLISDTFGGPHTLTIGDITINNIMVGYVWLCSGQSNMELPINRVRRMFEEELQDVNYTNIRAFSVKKSYNFNKCEQLYEGNWQSATNDNINNFFAVPYFFAVKLWEKYGIPIGLINSAAGGSTAEAWISEETLTTSFPQYAKILKECQETDFVKNTENSDLKNMSNWFNELDSNDTGKAEAWESTSYDHTSWDERELLESWENDLNFNGSVWFHKEFHIPESMTSKPATLMLGTVTDSNYVYINGEFVGRIEYKYPPSIFQIPPNLLKIGKNEITIRVISSNGLGGFVKDKQYILKTTDEQLDLNGKWKYKVGTVAPPMPPSTFFYIKPTGLYNAMLYPIIGYSITGAIWYQGESNAGYPDNYKDLMNALITEWRTKWGKDIPFIFTQLTNFESNSAPYPDSKWAELREQQLLCLDIPNTAMAVTIDCGEYNDLHPLDKKTVGERLAIAALKLAYNEDIIHSGPIIDKATFKDDTITLSFKHTANGLFSPSNQLNCFEIKTESGNYIKVNAAINNHTIIIYYQNDDKPVLVRYAWADNPHKPNLYNSEKLPASPFKITIN